MGNLEWHKDTRYQSAYYADNGDLRHEVYYDSALRMWTAVVKDSQGNQIGNAAYYPTLKIAKSHTESTL